MLPTCSSCMFQCLCKCAQTYTWLNQTVHINACSYKCMRSQWISKLMSRPPLSQKDSVLTSCLHTQQSIANKSNSREWLINLYNKSTFSQIVSELPLVNNDCGCLLLCSNTRHSPQIVCKVQWYFKAKITVMNFGDVTSHIFWRLSLYQGSNIEFLWFLLDRIGVSHYTSIDEILISR